ncbi:MAG: electron transfer flavoprotein subunit beta/FixA family protein [Deltaproteobacteria bacterium]|nr:electron transfer flavoprotein subunit beta/FixA family protein [Deltaproteobacteria bacterium]
MKIAVLVKEVPDLEALVKVGEGGKTLEVEKKRCLNFFDEIAVEAALRMKQAAGGSVYAVSAGMGTGLEAVRRALAMGADSAFLIDDPALADADPLTVARALAALCRREGFDLILAGKQATDDEAGLVGPMVAELLELPCAVAITSLEVKDSAARVERETERGNETLRVPLPAVLTTEKGLFEPRVPQVMGLMKAMKAQVPKTTLQELGVAAAAAPAVAGYRAPARRAPVKMLEGEPAAAASQLVKILHDEARVI